jgi:hypothetical protein
MKTLLASLVLMAIVTGTALGQWQIEFGAGTIIDDNAFNTSQRIPDRITALSLGLSHTWETDNTSVNASYNGEFNYFALVPTRTFSAHEGGVTYDLMFNEEQDFLFEGAAAYSTRINRPEFNVFDYSQFSLSAQARGHASDAVLLKGGYTFKSLAFGQVFDFNYIEHMLTASSVLNLAQRTTLVTEADFGLKKYLTPNPTTATGSSTGRQSGRMGGSVSTPEASQLIGSFRIGQGLSATTGLSLSGQYQWSLSKESRYLVLDEGTLTDDELFDDHYGYEGGSLMMKLTQTMPSEAKAVFSASIQDRRYSSRPAYDLIGNQVASQRKDTRIMMTAGVEKEFTALSLKAGLEFNRIINLSNDVLYDYRNSVLSLHLAFVY